MVPAPLHCIDGLRAVLRAVGVCLSPARSFVAWAGAGTAVALLILPPASARAQSLVSLGGQVQGEWMGTSDVVGQPPPEGGGALDLDLGIAARVRLAKIGAGLVAGLRGSLGVFTPRSYVLAPQIGFAVGSTDFSLDLVAEGGLHGVGSAQVGWTTSSPSASRHPATSCRSWAWRPASIGCTGI
jgi:hypothetical protein